MLCLLKVYFYDLNKEIKRNVWGSNEGKSQKRLLQKLLYYQIDELRLIFLQIAAAPKFRLGPFVVLGALSFGITM